ncbi:hypothetical protein [Streptomyces sp. AN091965]|uniref:hypothetical protein n=1 Tax=Streptomyces sp. AN091965 TaxID=2927803 RepID=UPI001F60D2E0|nr:hypothetical protein [Streptomyces sp. AN091965]MCI3927738.1 hypothetical protein [Streptomyces sp. AN091965]
MRSIYVCIGCAALYLPPEDMAYPCLGLTASPAHCTGPGCAAAVREAVALCGLPQDKLGELARRAVGLEGQPRRPRLHRRPARGRRAAAAPGGGRGKLR